MVNALGRVVNEDAPARAEPARSSDRRAVLPVPLADPPKDFGELAAFRGVLNSARIFAAIAGGHAGQ